LHFLQIYMVHPCISFSRYSLRTFSFKLCLTSFLTGHYLLCYPYNMRL
jgi:hypothetical protein